MFFHFQKYIRIDIIYTTSLEQRSIFPMYSILRQSFNDENVDFSVLRFPSHRSSLQNRHDYLHLTKYRKRFAIKESYGTDLFCAIRNCCKNLRREKNLGECLTIFSARQYGNAEREHPLKVKHSLFLSDQD